MQLKKELGKRIKYLRKKLGYTQERLADLVQIDPKSISKIENGNIYPAPETLTSIIFALNVEPWELFVFDEIKDIESMKDEIISLINNDEKILIHLYQNLKMLKK